jgi:iron complex transport system substrate-binding protein
MRYFKTAKSHFKLGAQAALGGLLLSASFVSGTPASAREIVDFTGTKVQVVESPKRIVTLAPSLGELAADLLGNNIQRIIGVSEYTDYPPVLKRVESVGPYFRFNLEKVAVLKPDLVLATTDGNPKDQVLHLRELGLPVVVVSTHSFKEIEDSIRLVAKSLSTEKEGDQIVGQLQRGIERIRARTRDLPKKKVLLQIGAEPFVVVGRASFLHEAIEAVGGSNVYSDADSHYPRPAMEDAVSRNPDVILILALGNDLRPFQQMLKNWQSFPGLRAVKSHQVKLLKSDPIFRPSLRLLEGLAILEKAVHG